MVLIVDDQIGQVSRLLQMPAGVSEHCSVVRHYFVMVIRIFMLSTMINHHFHHCVIDHRYCKKLRDQFLARWFQDDQRERWSSLVGVDVETE